MTEVSALQLIIPFLAFSLDLTNPMPLVHANASTSIEFTTWTFQRFPGNTYIYLSFKVDLGKVTTR